MSRRSRIRNIIQDLEEVCSSNHEIHFQYIENYHNNAGTNPESYSITRRNTPNNNVEDESRDNIADITVSVYETSAENNTNINESIDNTTPPTNSSLNVPNSTTTSHQNMHDNTTDTPNNIQSHIRNIPVNITETSNISSTIANSIDSILNDLPSITGSELSVGANIFRVENLVPLHNQTRVQNGLTISELNEKTTIYTNPTLVDNDKCHICNELFTKNCILRRNIKCEHYFHQGCIDTWYAENHKCPICNQNIRE